MEKIEESLDRPKLWRFDNYVEIQVEQARAKDVFGGQLGEFLSEGKPVVLVPVEQLYIDAEFEEVTDGAP